MIAYKMLQVQGLPKVKECKVLALYEAMSWFASIGYENVLYVRN